MPYMLEAPGETKLGLAAELLRGHGTLHLKARGTSMLPSVWPGDLVTIQSVADDEAVVGDILLVLRDNRFFVHRLVERRLVQDCLLLIMKGDAMPHNDPPATASQLLGRVPVFAAAIAVSLRNVEPRCSNPVWPGGSVAATGSAISCCIFIRRACSQARRASDNFSADSLV
jgi:Peptidase S24-like